MTRLMRDSVNPSAIPIDTPIVAGYVAPSSFAGNWNAVAWGRFPNSLHVRISPSASMYAPGVQVLDVEPGDASAAQVPGWVTGSRRVDQEPTVYTNAVNWAAVINACLSAGVEMPDFWIAEWDGVPNFPSITVGGKTYTAIAKQYADPNAGSGGDYDVSIVADYWPGVDGSRDMNPTDTIPFTNNDGSVVQVQAQTVWANADFYAGKAMNAVLDPTSGNAAILKAIQTLAGNVGGALQQEEADLLAAIKSIPAGGSVSDAQMAALTSALEAALPSYTVSIAPKPAS